jgi:hypothetical protein
MYFFTIIFCGGTVLYIIFIRNYRLKLILAVSALSIGIIALLFTHYILNNNLALKVTIDDYISFTHPISFQVNNIYVNEILNEEAVKVNYSFKKTALKNFTDFNNLKENFSVKYPASFTLAQKEFAGSDILYHIDFQNQDIGAFGFMQVWNLPFPLTDFLSLSEVFTQNDCKEFSGRTVEVNGLKGYLWDYSVPGKNNKYYKGSEVFLKKGERMYRISYFIMEEKWNKSHSEIFKNIVQSFKLIS